LLENNVSQSSPINKPKPTAQNKKRHGMPRKNAVLETWKTQNRHKTPEAEETKTYTKKGKEMTNKFSPKT